LHLTASQCSGFTIRFLVLSAFFFKQNTVLKEGGICEDLIIRGYLFLYFDMHVEQGDSVQERGESGKRIFFGFRPSFPLSRFKMYNYNGTIAILQLQITFYNSRNCHQLHVKICPALKVTGGHLAQHGGLKPIGAGVP